ncbi:hypothetical protein ATSB10_03250 [Dyella thiooxydans]|uniref:Uncharacterized protein n=1 Tax=Dyella thiooxydans TaxID=445710 RepID=A0A161J1J2_9GAMM|nr:hypothetical protein [Dyella thiooxydans]AND67779.1 hypothetical protein ATSB10_03250 [Dyella thiooxydans]
MKPAHVRIRTVDPATPLGERFATGLGYPLRGAALPTLVGLALVHYLGLLPLFLGTAASLLVWGATWRYAAECMLHTANGFADPPDVGLGDSDRAAWGLTAVHVLAAVACVAVPLYSPGLFWPTLLAVALVLPAIDMALAFDGSLPLALNPLHWGEIIRRFGWTYLLPVGINVAVGILAVLASLVSARLPRLLSLPLFAFACTYLIVLGFHLMGAMIHRRHEHFGLTPEAEVITEALGGHDDQRLLDQVRELATNDPMAATRLLVPRLQDREAPAELHQAYRDLLRRQRLNDALLVHGQIRIAALMANNEPRKALGMVQDCMTIDPDFLPDDPGNAGALAETASRSGMRRMALKLCRGWLARWPRDGRAPTVALLAARELEAEGQAMEAAVLLGRIASAWTDHPQHGELLARIQQLHSGTRA